MGIHNINFKDETVGTVSVRIDGETDHFNIYEIDKIPTEFDIIEMDDVAIFNDIYLKARLQDDDSTIKKGVVWLTVFNLNGTAVIPEQSLIIDEYIEATIPNNLTAGIYIVQLEYKGDKYHLPVTKQRYIRVSKRKVVCQFDHFEYHVKADSMVQLQATIKDLETLKPVNNYTIQYKFNDEINELTTNSYGVVDFVLAIPESSQEACSGVDDISYKLLVSAENENYILKNTSVKLIIDKEMTTIDIEGRNEVIDGTVITQNGYPTYGTVNISIPSVDYNRTVSVVNGFFTHQLDISSIIQGMSSNVADDKVYSVSSELNTNLTLESIYDSVTVGDSFVVTGFVQDENGNPVPYGTIDFRLIKDNKTVYRYITEVDEGGNGDFIFYTSKTGRYSVKAYYSTIVGYKDSQSNQDVIIEVEDGS